MTHDDDGWRTVGAVNQYLELIILFMIVKESLHYIELAQGDKLVFVVNKRLVQVYLYKMSMNDNEVMCSWTIVSQLYNFFYREKLNKEHEIVQ